MLRFLLLLYFLKYQFSETETKNPKSETKRLAQKVQKQHYTQLGKTKNCIKKIEKDKDGSRLLPVSSLPVLQNSNIRLELIQSKKTNRKLGQNEENKTINEKGKAIEQKGSEIQVIEERCSETSVVGR